MPRLVIPERYKSGLQTILSIDEPTFARLVEALSELPPTVNVPLRQSRLKIAGIDRKELDPVLLSVNSLFIVWAASADRSLDQFVSELVEAFEDFDPKPDTATAKERFRELLAIEPLASSLKAQAVMIDHQRTFYEAKVLTDVRNAFRPDPEAEPYGAVILHTLKLAYHEDGEHRQFFVVLDGEDISRLKVVLDRAQAKARTIKKSLEASGLRYLGKGDE